LKEGSAREREREREKWSEVLHYSLCSALHYSLSFERRLAVIHQMTGPDGRTFRRRSKMKNLKSFARVGKRGGKRQQWQLQRNQQKESCECSYLGPITRKRAREINLEDEEPSCSYEQQPSLFTRTPASPQSCNSSETTEHPEISTNSDVSEVETVDMKMDTSTSTSRRRRWSLRSSKKHKTEEEAQQQQQQQQRQRRRESAATTTTPSSKVGSPSSSSPLDLIENFLGRCESQARKKQKDLADKYNYDFEKDMPARGNKFEWTQVKT
jgi:DNA-binding TFAR19-related protein (PDSD5 family)